MAHFALGTAYFVMESQMPMSIHQTINRDAKVPCKLCGINAQLKAMRNHVGRHIWLYRRGIIDHPMVKFGQRVCFSALKFLLFADSDTLDWRGPVWLVWA